jgi:multifunctional 2-oxoglutarate metabolism enzyme
VLPPAHTAVDRAALDRVYQALSTTPADFVVHPKLVRQFEQRDAMWQGGDVDWALGEALAFGSLVDQGISVRLTGQDSRRGTFSHRHATLVDYESGVEYVPLSALSRDGSQLWIYDSLLSEYAALGFEYGYSVANKDVLTMWEAQFGDFNNGAQIIIDQFIVAAEHKWNQTSGLVMLLPHGYEGQGPEHSSARIERFLTLAADDNIQVCNATTAAQYFHLLRRQMLRSVRHPLIVFTPKSQLRARTSRSTVDQLTSGTFEEVLDDGRDRDRRVVRRIVLASGKVAIDALAARDQRNDDSIAVVRVEQLYPWPYDTVESIVRSYRNATEMIWLQEEPENMGAWNFVKGKLFDRYDETHRIERVSRHESGSPATGSGAVHAQEQSELIERALGS